MVISQTIGAIICFVIAAVFLVLAVIFIRRKEQYPSSEGFIFISFALISIFWGLVLAL